MDINFDIETQHLVFKPEYISMQPALPITVIKGGIEYMIIDPNNTTQEQMVEHYTVHKLWHLFDIVDNPQ